MEDWTIENVYLNKDEEGNYDSVIADVNGKEMVVPLTHQIYSEIERRVDAGELTVAE